MLKGIFQRRKIDHHGDIGTEKFQIGCARISMMIMPEEGQNECRGKLRKARKDDNRKVVHVWLYQVYCIRREIPSYIQGNDCKHVEGG